MDLHRYAGDADLMLDWDDVLQVDIRFMALSSDTSSIDPARMPDHGHCGQESSCSQTQCPT